MDESGPCAVLLLAAGASRRMGRPKQLLPVGGVPLVRAVAEQMLRSQVGPLIVVLGAGAPEILPCLHGLDARMVLNEKWEEGMGSSIRAGMRALVKLTPTPASVILALADQPGLPAGHLGRLVATHRESRAGIVASAVDGVARPPVLFGAAWFSRLGELQGDAGARNLVRENPGDVALLPLAAAIDLDTPEDYERMKAGQG